MKNEQYLQDVALEKIFPVLEKDGRRFLALPDRLDVVMEDGTVFHVRSFFDGNQQMGGLLDALTVEKVNRAG